MESFMDTLCTSNKCNLFIAATVLAATVLAIAQTDGGAGGDLQQKLAAAKESAAVNQQKLHQYQWIETTQLTLKGDLKLRRSQCASTVLTERYRRRRWALHRSLRVEEG